MHRLLTEEDILKDMMRDLINQLVGKGAIHQITVIMDPSILPAIQRTERQQGVQMVECLFRGRREVVIPRIFLQHRFEGF
jgi:hypothetical protein